LNGPAIACAIGDGPRVGGSCAQTLCDGKTPQAFLSRLACKRPTIGKGSGMNDDIVREFLVESNENLELLDRELVLLEKDPQNKATPMSFRAGQRRYFRPRASAG
jgi:hypothetical protein